MAINRSIEYTIWNPPVPESKDWKLVENWWVAHGIPALPEVAYNILAYPGEIPPESAPESRPPSQIMVLVWRRPEQKRPLVTNADTAMNDPDWMLFAVMRYFGTPYKPGETPDFIEVPPTPDQPPPPPPPPVVGDPMGPDYWTGNQLFACPDLNEPTLNRSVREINGIRYLKHRLGNIMGGVTQWWERVD
jgi:hypothetical protein